MICEFVEWVLTCSNRTITLGKRWAGKEIAMIELTLDYFKMHILHLNNNNKIGRVSVSSTIHRFTDST